MSKSKNPNYLKNADLGRLVAEQDSKLSEYYINKEKYVDKACDPNDPATFFIGPKGVGKSAILQMVRLLNTHDSNRIVNITPDDLAFSALANIDATTPLLKEFGKNQWPFKSLWDYVISLEVLRREYRTDSAIGNILTTIFGARHEKEAKRLLKISLSDTGSPHSLSSRILMLINEVDVSAEHSGTKISGKVKLDIKDLDQGSHLKTLGLISSVAKHVHDNLHNTYYILIDDLDTNWSDTPIQNEFLAALFLSLKNFSKPPRLKCVVSMKEQIFRRLPLQDRDKLRDWICLVEWDYTATKQMLTKRIRETTNIEPSLIWNTMFPSDAFDRMWKHTNGLPREILRLATLAINEGKRSGHQRVGTEDFDNALIRFSDERIDDLDSEYSHTFPSLNLVLRKFHDWPREFSYTKFLNDFVELLAYEVELREGQSNRYTWAGGYSNNPREFARTLLSIGFLQYKSSRTAKAQSFNYNYPPEINNNYWFSIHPMYLPALGIASST